MLFSDAILKVRAGTLHDADTQFTDTQLLAELVDEYRRLRRWLCVHVPTLCEATVSGIAATEAAPYIAKSALVDFERVILVSKLYGSSYYPVDVSSGLDRLAPCRLSVHETPTQLSLTPAAQAAGTWQVIYAVGAAATLTTASLIDLPDGLADVVVERGCVWARQRHNEDWQYHEKRAERIQAEQCGLLKARYGSHGQSGLKRERGAW
jgi:hypothetical protein